jgi:prophage antirepressor-like protein
MSKDTTNRPAVQTALISIVNQQEVLGKNFAVYGSFYNPLFLAKDVAEWIEHSNVSKMLENVDAEEKLNLFFKETNLTKSYVGSEAAISKRYAGSNT